MARLPTKFDLGTVPMTPSRGVTMVSPAQERAVQVAPDQSTALAFAGASEGMEAFAVTLKRETEKLDKLVAEDALNKIRQERLNLEMGEGGALSVKGGNVLTPTYMSGYTDRFKTFSESVVSKLTPAQQALLKPHVDSEDLGFKQGILRHSMREVEQHAIVVEKGTIDTITNIGVRSVGDPVAFDEQIRAMSGVVKKQAERAGLRQGVDEDLSAFVALDRAAKSPMISGAITAALADKSASGLSRAEELLSRYGASMDDATMLKAQGLITTMRAGLRADSAVSEVLSSASPETVPNAAQRLTTLAGATPVGNVDIERLLTIQTGEESGGRRYGKDGKILEGPMTKYGTAKGERQVLDSTNADPGYGVRPAQDDSPAERARVGNDYMLAMMRKYAIGRDGKPRSEDETVSLALAAYNWGPGNVDSALAYESNPKNDTAKKWRDFLPAETKDYVDTILTRYKTGDTGTAAPTITDAKRALRLKLAGESIETISAAEAKLESRWGDAKAANAQRVDELMLSIRRRIDSGELVSPDQLSSQEKTLLGNNVTNARNLIEAESRKSDKALALSVAGTDFYYQMREDPTRLKATSIATIMGMTPDIGRARVDALLTERDRLIKQPDIEKQAVIDAQQFKALAAKANITDKAALVQYQDRIEELIVEKQNALKRSLTREEKKDVIISAFTTFPVKTEGMLWGLFGTGSTTKRGADIAYKQNIIVPEEYRKSILAQAKAAGAPVPDDDELRSMYSARLAREQRLR